VSAVSSEFNPTDAMFLQMMLAYADQDRKILPLAKTRVANDDLKTLAAAIEVTQGDEATTMTAWLRTWKQPLTTASDPAVHAGHGGLHQTNPDELAALQAASGADFDKRFLNLLIGHQHNAVEIARMEVASGTNPEAKALAQRVDQSRTAEIEQMLKMVA
jgi:uncharacterized protein (DUF305 family)